jgi:uncharacterized membrane protein YgcG
MRLTLLAAVLLLSLHTCLAAVPVSVSLPVDPTAKSPANKPAPDKRKGTVGFISGLLLGPVGLGGVYLFLHSHVQRKAAKKGCVIFAEVVVVAALCWLVLLGAKDIGSSGWGSSSRSSGGGSSSSGGGSRSSGGSGRSGSSHSSNNNWANNINLPDINSSSPTTKKKPVPAQLPAQTQLPADWPSRMFFMY